MKTERRINQFIQAYLPFAPFIEELCALPMATQDSIFLIQFLFFKISIIYNISIRQQKRNQISSNISIKNRRTCKY